MQVKIDYPRETAVKILHEINNENAFTNIILQKRLSNPNLSEVDRSFVTTLVYGVVKNRNYCDWIISSYSNTKFNKISPWIKEILRTALYQILFLDKVPDYAAVNESVKMSKKYSRGKADKFVNGILRAVLRNKEAILDHEFDYYDRLTIKYSAPHWLVDYLRLQYPDDVVESFFVESLKKPPITVRVNTLKTDRDSLMKVFASEGIKAVKGSLPISVVIDGYGDITKYESYRDGLFIVQDEAAMLAVDTLDPKPGEKVLDMCSAPGGKTTYIAEMLRDKPGLTARDVYEHKVKLVKQNCSRLDINSVQVQLKDGIQLYGDDICKYDKVLLDSPCSGLGILRRKPDIKWKLTKRDVEDIIRIQKTLIENAFKYLRSGGTLVYCTCTVNREENEGIVHHLLKKNANAKLLEIHGVDPECKMNSCFIQTFPKEGRCDGFFISKIRKVAEIE